MDQFNFSQIIVLLIQCLLISSILLLLFRLRKKLGNGLLFAAIGVLQYMQVFLANTISYEVYPGFMVSPGSVVLFSASLFLVLLIYIREDAKVLRTLIYALVGTNVVLSLLLYVIGWNIENPGVINPYQLPSEFFEINVRVLFVGTAVLLVDSILLILAYEAISKWVASLFFRIFFTMALVLMTDAVLFSIGAFFDHGELSAILISGVVSKLAAAFVFSLFFTLYLLFIEKKDQEDGPKTSFEDVFSLLSYRQKFEKINLEKEQQQKALKESEYKYKALFEQGGDAIYLADIKGRIIEANVGATIQLGFTKEELQQKNLCELHPDPLPIEKVHSFWKNLMLNEPVQHEGLHQKKGGFIIPVEITTSKIRLSQQDYILGFVRDVSSKKEAEKKQLELADRYKSILQTSLDGFILSDLDGNILEVNEAYCKMVGYTKEELLEMSIAELDAHLKPEEVQEIIDSLITTGGARFETTHLHRKGNRVELEVSVSALRREGLVLAVNFCRDITSPKHLDGWKKLNAFILEKTTKGESLASILQAITTGIDDLIPTAFSSIMLLNDKEELVTAATSRLPESWIEFVDNLKPGPTVGSCGSAVHFGKRIISADIENDSKWVDFKEMAAKHGLKACWSEPIIDGDRDLALGTFGVYFQEEREPSKEEITLIESVAHLLSIIIKKISSERALAQYNTQLEAEVSLRTQALETVNEELKSFSYSVSHDLRAPLTRLDGFSKALQDRYAEQLDKKGMHYLTRIRVASQQMAILIDNMLYLSRISRKEVKREELDIGQLARDIIVQMKEGEPNRKIKAVIASQLTTYADKRLTQLMLENLLQNAWKFSQNNDSTLIEIGQTKDNGHRFFYIKDNGIGFDMKYYDQLFRPFHRLHSSVEIEGHGIGLATVQRIIKKHGGLIKAEGRPNQGATFYFNLEYSSST